MPDAFAGTTIAAAQLVATHSNTFEAAVESSDVVVGNDVDVTSIVVVIAGMVDDEVVR